MPIRFKCPSCKKALAVKDQMAGKKAACPVCKKPLVIPTPRTPPVSNPADVEDFAASLLSDPGAAKVEEKPKSTQTIDFTCPFCDAELHLPADLGGKKEPCPECKNIIKVPQLVKEQAKDWRTVEKTGPSGAAGKAQPELAGAWGSTTNKGKVSMQALEEADAIIYEDDDDETNKVGRWIKRITIFAAVGGLVFLAIWGLNRRRDTRQQKDSMARALETVEKAKINDRLPAAWIGQIHRAAGEFYAAKRDPKEKPLEQIQNYFKLARNPLIVLPADKKLPLEYDMAQPRTLLSVIELAGTPEEIDDKVRLDWKDVHKDFLYETFRKIRPVEAKVLALRAMADKLVTKKQGFRAAALARRLYDDEKLKPLLAQWVAFAHDPNMQGSIKDLKEQAIKALPPPNPNRELDVDTRTAYAEGLAREGNLAKALQLAKAPGRLPQDQMQAALAVANVARDKTPEESGLKFALDLADGDLKDNVPPWLALQLVQATVRAGLLDQAKEIAKNLPPEMKCWGELEIFRSQLAKNEGLAEANLVEQITDANSLARALAWEAWARHNTRLGHNREIEEEWKSVTDPRFRPFIDVGTALGVQDRAGR